MSICQKFGNDVKKGYINSSELTISVINTNLSHVSNNRPDPDVAIYFGDVCGTYGLLPWNIRLTEFFGIGKISTIYVEKFTSILKKYDKCEQRFGK